METTLWAKLPDGLTESAELIVTWPDDFRTEEDLRAEKFLPLVYTDAPTEPLPRGWFWNARYHVEGEYVVQFWVDEKQELPPRVFSKLKLKGAIATAGLLPAFKELLSGMEVAPGYSAQEAFDDAVNLSEAHPRFVEAVDIAKQVLAVTDEQVEEILAASVAEGSA